LTESEVTNSLLAETSGGLHGMRSAGAIKTNWYGVHGRSLTPCQRYQSSRYHGNPRATYNKLAKTKDGQYIR